MIAAEFSDTDFKYETTCTHCSISLLYYNCTSKSLKKHLQKSSHCLFALQFQAKIELKKIAEDKIVDKKIVEKSKLQSLRLYENRLANLNI